MSANSFKHRGRISGFTDGRLQISLQAIASCEGCRAKAYCSSSSNEDSNLREMDIACEDSSRFRLGERVEVSVSHSLGGLAIFFCYVLPLFVFVSSILLIVYMLDNEAFAAIGGFLSLFVYYLLIYKMRDRFERKISFTVRKI